MKSHGLKIALALAALTVTSANAFAVSSQVRINCRGDYFAFCSQHAVGSQALRQCMRAHSKQLSQGCKTALIQSGEAGKQSVARNK